MKISSHSLYKGKVFLLDKIDTVLPRIIARGDYSFFSHRKGAIMRGKAIISNIAHLKSCPQYFVLLSH